MKKFTVRMCRCASDKEEKKNKKLLQNGQEYKSHIGELKGVGAETTVPIIQ